MKVAGVKEFDGLRRASCPIGSMGQRVFQPIVNQQVTNVLDALEQQIADAKIGQ